MTTITLVESTPSLCDIDLEGNWTDAQRVLYYRALNVWVGWHTDYANDTGRVCSCGCKNGYYDYEHSVWVCPKCGGEE